MSREGYGGIPIPRGDLVEQDMLGRVRAESSPKPEGYVAYKEALNWVKVHQPALPTNPIKPFAHELRIAVMEKLGFETPEQFNKVRFYTAVGSGLDYWHQTDAFIEVDADREKLVPGGRVTLGITTRDKTGEIQKVDIEIWVPDDGLDETDKKFDSAVQTAASAIVKKLHGASSSIVNLHE